MKHCRIIENIDTDINLYQLLPLLEDLKYSGLLDSSLKNTDTGRYSILFAYPFLVLENYGLKTKVYRFEQDSLCSSFYETGNPFTIFENYYQKYNVILSGDMPIPGGAIGFFSYELYHFNDELKCSVKMKKPRYNAPLYCIGFYDALLIEDLYSGKKFIISTGIGDHSGNGCEAMAKQKIFLYKKLISRFKEYRKPVLNKNFGDFSMPLVKQISKKAYLEKIKNIKKRIKKGEIFQACFTYQKEVEFNGSAFDLYNVLREINPAPFSCFFNFLDFQIVCCSPERFLYKTTSGVLETRPIKGTRKRGDTEESDKLLREELKSSIKDQAENIMIVDLLRNDLGKKSVMGSVEVENLFKIEEYSNVFQLVSIIKGKEKKGRQEKVLECFKALFPGGSMTGAPKIRAVEILNRLERQARGIYSGSIGYFGFNNSFDTNIVIRTLVKKGKKVYIGTGGGIVHDSDPELEYKESNDKVEILLRAIAYLNHICLAGKSPLTQEV